MLLVFGRLLREDHPRNDIYAIKTQTGRDCHDPFWLFSRFLFFFDLVDFASFEVSAVRADDVRQALVPAIGAGNQVGGNQRVL